MAEGETDLNFPAQGREIGFSLGKQALQRAGGNAKDLGNVDEIAPTAGEGIGNCRAHL